MTLPQSSTTWPTKFTSHSPIEIMLEQRLSRWQMIPVQSGDGVRSFTTLLSAQPMRSSTTAMTAVGAESSLRSRTLSFRYASHAAINFCASSFDRVHFLRASSIIIMYPARVSLSSSNCCLLRLRVIGRFTLWRRMYRVRMIAARGLASTAAAATGSGAKCTPLAGVRVRDRCFFPSAELGAMSRIFL